MIGRLLCKLGYHDWYLKLRRVGEHQRCRRHPDCDAVAYATERGWVVRSGSRADVVAGTAPRTRRSTRPR